MGRNSDNWPFPSSADYWESVVNACHEIALPWVGDYDPRNRTAGDRMKLQQKAWLCAIIFVSSVSFLLPWFSTRRRYLFPFAERLLWFSSALSSFPGQVPTQEVNCAAEGNVLACTPTSEITCCAESSPKPGTFGQAGHGLLMWFQRLRDHAVEPGDLLVDQLQPFQLQRE